MARKTKKDKLLAELRRLKAKPREKIYSVPKNEKPPPPTVLTFDDYSYVKKDLLKISLLTIAALTIQLSLYFLLKGNLR